MITYRIPCAGRVNGLAWPTRHSLGSILCAIDTFSPQRLTVRVDSTNNQLPPSDRLPEMLANKVKVAGSEKRTKKNNILSERRGNSRREEAWVYWQVSRI